MADKRKKLAGPTGGYMMDSLDEVEGFKTAHHTGGHSHALSAAQRRKIGQKPKMAHDLPKKSGYLLKKGPLKVRQRFVAPRGGSASCSGRGVASRLNERWLLLAQVWQKRWFVLEDGELSYFRSHEQVSALASSRYSLPLHPPGDVSHPLSVSPPETCA